MQNLSLFTQFKNIARGVENSNAFNVISLPESVHKLGVSSDGFPIFFVRTCESAMTVHNIVREILSVEYSQLCTIVENDSTSTSATFSIITLRAREETLQSYFIDIVVMMLSKFSGEPTHYELAVEVENLITIFSAVSRKPIKKIQGLWAEMLVIERSSNPEFLISAWHDSPEAKYDFSMGEEKIEVKSTSGEGRIHRFSLDQLNPSQKSKLLIASVVVRESAECSGGLSVSNLYEKICQQVSDTNLRLKLYSTLISSIGSDYEKTSKLYFDYVEATDSLAFFDAKDVPHIDKTVVPEFVSDVKFSSSLTHLTDVREKETASVFLDSTLFRCLI